MTSTIDYDVENGLSVHCNKLRRERFVRLFDSLHKPSNVLGKVVVSIRARE